MLLYLYEYTRKGGKTGEDAEIVVWYNQPAALMLQWFALYCSGVSLPLELQGLSLFQGSSVC